MNSTSWVELSSQALKNNLDVAQQCAPEAKIMAVIKANAYGHGILESALALSSSNAFAVARISEGLTLRTNGIQQDIVILSGIVDASDLEICARYELIPVIHSVETVKAVLTYDAGNFEHARQLKVWIKANTGMNRLGLSLKNLKTSVTAIKEHPDLDIVGIMSHFVEAEEIDSSVTRHQLELFLESVSDSDYLPKSIANSAGVLFHENSHLDWVRPGIMLYGANPSHTTNSSTLMLKPVMNFKTRVLKVSQIGAGETVGYNGIWTAKTDTTIATLSVGYADGYPRHAKNGTPVLINNKRYPLSGRVSMDMITVDVGDDDIRAGDEVILWGEGLPAEEVASYADAISYQLFCGITSRVERRYF